MKILHIIASYKPAYIYGGPIMSVSKLCECLREVSSRKYQVESGKTGDEKREIVNRQWASNDEQEKQKVENGTHPLTFNSITVYTTLANGEAELPYPSGSVKIVDGVAVHYFKRLTKDHSHFSPALFWHLWKTAKDFDIIHIHAWWNLVSIFSCLIAVLKNRKIIFTPRGTLSTYSFNNRTSTPKKLFHKYIGRPLLNRCHIHTTSKREENDIRLLLNPKKITTIFNLVELPWQQAALINHEKQAFNETLKLIFLSRVEQKKGLELLFHVLSKVDFPYHLEIAGTGETSYITELKQLSEQLEIQQHISWLGMLDKEEKFIQLVKNDLFILPSFDENFANVVIESLFTGTPVLITENVGLSDYVTEKNLGWVCERTEQDLLTKLWQTYREISDNKIDRFNLQKTIVTDFKEANIIERYVEMYREMSSQENEGSHFDL